jgi:hypothetical protein
MLSKIGAPSAGAYNELPTWRRPPCTEAVCGRALARRAREPIVDEDVPRRGWLLRREPAALHEIAEAIFIQRAHPPPIRSCVTLCADRKSEKRQVPAIVLNG